MALELGVPGVITYPTYPRLPNTSGEEVWLDPKNIPSKHQGIWKPRVIGAPQLHLSLDPGPTC